MELENFKEQVKKGFAACKSDIDELKTENTQLRQMLLEFAKSNETLSTQVLELQAQIKGLNIALEYIKDFKEKTEKKEEQVQQVPEIKSKPSIQSQQILSTKSKDPYEALLAFKAKSNKRDMLKQKLLSMIGEGGMNLSELKFMFVEHFKYSSKATFYNYLKELELEKTIRIERENTKNFVYLYSIRKEV